MTAVTAALRGRKGIFALTEHLMTIFFLIIVILGLIILLTGYQASRLALEKQKTETDHALAVLTTLLGAPGLTSEYGMFDDTALLVAKNMDLFCEEMEKQFGYPWFAVIQTTGGDCGTAYSATCGRWSFCERNERNVSFTVPVNVRRLFVPGYVTGKMEFGLLRVGVYQ